MLERSVSLPFVKFFLTVVGVFVVLYGIVDIASRLDKFTIGNFSNLYANQTNTEVFGSFAMQQEQTQTAIIIPSRIEVPAIGVDASVEQVGTTTAGAMATPKNFMDVGWYSQGGKPGASGSAVFAGHVNNALTRAGVFEHLSQTKIGDTISVLGTSADGTQKTLTYVVNEVDAYPADDAPTASIFTTTGPSQLVLITCDGSWVPGAHSFDKRFVVYAQLSAR